MAATEERHDTPPATHNDDGQALFSCRGVVKSYGHVDALKGVDFSLNRNEVVGLVGDNGAGKSTLIKIMSGVVQPDRGEFLYEGKQVPLRSRRDSEKLGIETIYQDIALVGSMSVMRNIFCGREITDRFGGLRLREMRRIAMDVLEHTVEIAGITSPDQAVEGLSGGQQQAVAIARAVYFKNKMLLLDEPTSALSVRETEKVLTYVTQLRADGVSCVFVTHNLYHAFQVCDRFVVMAHGEVITNVKREDTTLEEVTRIIVSY